MMLSSLHANQQKVAKAQTQITTGKEADAYSYFARDTSTLLGAKTLQSQNEGYINASHHIKRNLDANDVQLNAITASGEKVRDDILSALAQGKTYALMEILEESYGAITSSLNTNIGGVYIFGGARTDRPPVNGTTIADLQAAPAVNDLFDNDQNKARAKTNVNVEFEYGLLADDIGAELFSVYKAIADFNSGPSGPLVDELDATQRAFLEGELANLDQAIDTVRTMTARNGTRQANLDNIIEEHDIQENFLAGFISDLEDVDMAEAIARLNKDQVALQASYRISSELYDLSLLDFI